MRRVLVILGLLLSSSVVSGCGGGHASGVLPRTVADSAGPRAKVAHVAASDFPPGSYPADVLADGVVAYYRLDDPGHGSMLALTTLNSTELNFLTGAYGADVGLGNPSLTSVQTDASALFAGSGASADIASVPADPAFASALRGFTVEAWIKPANMQTTYYLPIVSYGRQVQGQAWVLQITAQSHLDLWFKTGGGTAKLPSRANNLIGCTKIAVGHIYYVAATYDGVSAKLYINGVLDGTAATAGPLDYDGILPQWGLGIGGALGPNAYGAHSSFSGAIDDVAIYASALPAARLMTHYHDGVDRAPTTGASHIYVPDAAGNRIVTYNAADGSPGSLTIANGVQSPSGVAVDPAGKIYVLNEAKNGSGAFTGSNVTTYDKQGAPSTPTISLAAAFGTAYVDVLSVDALGEIFVGDWQGATYAGQVAVYDAGGNLTGINFTIPSNAPAGIATTALGTYYVANNAYLGDCTVVGYPRFEGQTAATIDVPAPDCVGGVAVDAAGKIYITRIANSLRTYNADGTPASPTITDGLAFPGAVAVDALGKIYVANTSNHTITTYNPDGTRTVPTITLTYEPTAIAVH